MNLSVSAVRSEPHVVCQDAEPAAQPPRLLRRDFVSRAALRQARIGFLQHGGLYLPCEFHYPLKTKLCLLLGLAGEEQALCLCGTVAMTGPLPGIWAGRPGIALAFIDPDAASQVETLLKAVRAD